MRLPPWETGSPTNAPTMSGFLGGVEVVMFTMPAPSHEATSTVLSSMSLLWAARVGLRDASSAPDGYTGSAVVLDLFAQLGDGALGGVRPADHVDAQLDGLEADLPDLPEEAGAYVTLGQAAGVAPVRVVDAAAEGICDFHW